MKAHPFLALSALCLVTANVFAGSDLSDWEHATIRPVSAVPNRHTIHTYFHVNPESPDCKHVLFYTSTAENGETGELVVQDRLTKQETVIARDLHTEDAHRVACQQWMDGGRYVVYHDYREGHWTVLAYDVETKETRVLAVDRQLGFGSPTGVLVPLYGCHWKPGEHRDLEVVDVRTGEIRTVVKAADVEAQHAEYIAKRFPIEGEPMSIFFPVVSPDEQRVFFKMSRGSGKENYKSSAASVRDGKFVYDMTTGECVKFWDRWGHPSWHPDSRQILEKGNYVVHIETGKNRKLAPIPSDHPSFAPDGTLFVSDGKISKKDYAETRNLVVTVGSTTSDEQVRIDCFYSTAGARSWRKSHPHPVFSADGKRIYYNVNAGAWTELRVAEVE